MKRLFYFLSTILFFSCSNKKQPDTGFELKGNLIKGKGSTIYLEQLTSENSKIIDSAAIDDKGSFALHTRLPEAGFYNLKISERSFATLILDSLQKVTIDGNAQDLGNTFRVSGSEDSQLFWEVNQASKNNYRQRDSLQKTFQSYLNSKSRSQKQIDSLDKVIGVQFDQLVERHNKYLVDFVDMHSGSFASLVAIQQLDEEQYPGSYKKLDSALSLKYPDSMYLKRFRERSVKKKSN